MNFTEQENQLGIFTVGCYGIYNLLRMILFLTEK